MESNVGGGRKGAERARARVRIPHHERRHDRPEVRRRGDWLEVTLHVPHIPEKTLRHAVKSRYLIVWSDGEPHTRHQFVLLPEPVDPEDYHLSFLNGVVDARLHIRARRVAGRRAR